jgi:hypothetical protein
MAEMMSIMLRRNPKQLFTMFILWNLSALWRRIKKLQPPWASYFPSRKLEVTRNITTKVPMHTDKYLRSTSAINPYAPEIVALAMKLGMKEKSKREYIKAAYDYAKNEIYFFMEVPPKGVVNTLKRGYGLCFNKTSVFAALARVAGIPARFVSYQQVMDSGFLEMIASELIGNAEKEVVKEVQNSMPAFTHGCVEVALDGMWVSADITWTDEEEVGMGFPISQFGDSPFEKWYNVVPNTTSRRETIPVLGTSIRMKISYLLLRGFYDKLNERFQQIREKGKMTLEEIGRETYIKRMKKLYIPPPPLIFDE